MKYGIPQIYVSCGSGISPYHFFIVQGERFDANAYRKFEGVAYLSLMDKERDYWHLSNKAFCEKLGIPVEEEKLYFEDPTIVDH